MKLQKKQILAGIGVVALIGVLAVLAFARPAGAAPPAPLMYEKCDGALVLNLSDPNRIPVLDLMPGYGLVVSMDPGSITVNSETLIANAHGMLVALYNSTPITVSVSVETGWNPPNGRWNVHACTWATGREVIFATAKQWQGEPGSSAGEHKPVFRLLELATGGGFYDWTSVDMSTSTAVTNCDSTGAWKGDLDVPATCVVWISMDPGTGQIDDVKFSFDQRATLVVYGPATVKLASPPLPNVNHWLGPIGVVDVDNKDNAPVAKMWQPGLVELVDR